MGIWGSISSGLNDIIDYVPSAGGGLKTAGSEWGGSALDAGRDLVRDVPVLGNLFGQESSAERAAAQQQEALGQAQQYQEKMYQEAKGMLSPYQKMGQDILLGTPETQYTTIKTPFGEQKIPTGVTRSGGLVDRITGGEFVQDDFSYSGQKPSFDYQGKPMGAFDYQGKGQQGSVGYQGQQPKFDYQGAGQKGTIDYSGGPVDRSIESYMKDDPSLAWQQEQMEKMLNRQAAAGGRWGGGGTAREMMRETSGLLSQDYANRFNRAAQERQAAVGAERDKYGRAVDATTLANLAEQSAYGRASDQYNRDVLADQTAYNRALTDVNLANQAEQAQYGRDQYAYQTGVDREADMYGRAVDQYGRDVSAEQTDYNRAVQQYGIQGQNLQNQLNQLTALANYGPATAQAMANAAIGQGSSLSDLAIQQGNVAANATMAGGNQLAKILEMGGDIAKIAGAAG